MASAGVPSPPGRPTAFPGLFLTHRGRSQLRQLGLKLRVVPGVQSRDGAPQVGREGLGARWSVGCHVAVLSVEQTAAAEEDET